VTWKKYLPKSQGFCRIKKTEFLILDKVELTILGLIKEVKIELQKLSQLPAIH
jgi:hypothetical protein